MSSPRPSSAPFKRPKLLLFICTGNYYRSRFAEACFNHRARHQGLPWRAISRGFRVDWPGNIYPLSPYTREAMQARGIAPEMTGPDKLRLTLRDLNACPRAIALKHGEHHPLMLKKFPKWADRIEYWSVHDLDCAGPGETLALIEEKVGSLLGELARNPSPKAATNQS